VAFLDDESLLAVCAYIDLNPVAAGIAEAPETSEHTSIHKRVEHVAAQGQTAELEAASGDSVAGSHAAAGLEDSLWLCPIEDRRQIEYAGSRAGLSRGRSWLPFADHFSLNSARADWRSVANFSCGAALRRDARFFLCREPHASSQFGIRDRGANGLEYRGGLDLLAHCLSFALSSSRCGE